MLRLDLQKRFERIDCMHDLEITSVNLRLHGAASGGKTTTEASSLVLFLSNVMGSWLNGKSDQRKTRKKRKEELT